MNIRELARRAGLSKTTISAALRNAPRIPERTRQRVQILAKQMGYRPNPVVAGVMAAIARRNAEDLSSPILLLSDWPHPHEWERSDHGLARFYRGAVSRAEELGYKVDELWMGAPGMSPRRIEQIIATRHTEGLIVLSYPRAPAELRVDLSQYACAVIGRAMVKPAFDAVDHDHHQGMYLCLEKTKLHGYVRPGLLLSVDVHERTMHCWAAAYQFYLSQQPAKVRVPICMIGEKSGGNEFKKWLRTYKPDVVIMSHATMMEYIVKAGFEAPRDFGAAVLFHGPGSEHLAGIDICDEAIAGRAVDMVVDQMRSHRRGPPAHPETVLLRGVWRPGPSLPDSLGN